MKKLNNLLTVFVIITIAASAVVIALIHIELFKYHFSFTTTGIENYLDRYGDYKGLFTLTIASVAALSGLKSLGESIKANKERIKQDRFNEWKNGLEIRLNEISNNDPYIFKIFTQRRYRLFSVLYEHDFEIKDAGHLLMIFSIFKDVIPVFEEHNPWRNKLNGIYRDREHTYAFEAFCSVLYGGIDQCYADTKNDLKQLYLDNLPANRHIDATLYKTTFEDKRWPTVV